MNLKDSGKMKKNSARRCKKSGKGASVNKTNNCFNSSEIVKFSEKLNVDMIHSNNQWVVTLQVHQVLSQSQLQQVVKPSP